LLPNATASLFNLSPQEVDRVMCPIFEASGLADDFMPADERFPDRDDDGEAAGIGPDAAAIGVALSATRNPEHRAAMLRQLIDLANAGDRAAIDYLEANPELAFFDELTKKWVVQMDSGPRSPGIAVGRGRIVRTRRPPEPS